MNTDKICPKCAIAFQTDNKRQRYCSEKCQIRSKSNAQYHRRSKAVGLWRQRLKRKAIEYKGGKCEICGYNKCVRAMKFHHRNPTTKSFGIAAFGNTRSWDKVKEELDKCALLCGNCHDEVHENITNVPVYLNGKEMHC